MKLAKCITPFFASIAYWRIIVLSILFVSSAPAQWKTVPLGNTDWLRDVQLGLNGTGCLVGDNGRVMRTANNGATWTTEASGTTQMLRAVRFAGTHGWACGSQGTLIKSANGGGVWFPQSSNTLNSLNALHVANTNSAWVVGANGYIIRTSDGGTFWNFQDSGVTTALNGVFFHDLNTGWAVGDGGIIIHTVNGGATWTAQTSGVSVHLNSVYFVNATKGFVAGEQGYILTTTNGGTSWSRTRVPGGFDLKRVFFLDETNGWIAASKGAVLSTINGGGSWKAEKPPVHSTLESVFFSDTAVGVAVGFNGTMVRYFLGSKLGTVFLASVAKKGEQPPALTDTTFSSFGPAFVNAGWKAMFEAKLAGKGSSGGRLWGIFSTMSGPLTTLLRSKDALSDFGAGYEEAFAGRPVGPVLNRTDTGLFRLPMTGKSTNSRSNLALIRDTGAVKSPILRKGDALPAPDTGEIATVLELLQNEDQDAIALSYALRRDSALGVTSKNDTGLLLIKNDGTPLHALARAEKSAFGSGTFAKFVSRAASGLGTQVIFNAAWIPDGETKSQTALFHTSLDGLTNGRVLASSDEPPGLPGFAIRSFIAWSQSGGEALYRATFSGPGVKTTNNEGLWRGNVLLLRKGVTDVGGGLFAKRILRFWPVGADRVIIQVQLGGPSGSGVTSKNNQALLLCLADGSFHTLLRTGQVTPDIPEATLGSIQAVEVDPVKGGYAVLGSLRGVSTATNQALWRGWDTATTTIIDNFWVPNAEVRKGATYQTPTSPRTSILSISLKPAADKSGAGGRGLGRAFSSGGATIFILTSPGKVTELVQFMMAS